MCGVTNFAEAVAFVAGYDAALDGHLLRGFREWLIEELGDGDNLAWPSLVQRLTAKTFGDESVQPSKAAEVDFLMETISTFLDARSDVTG